MQNDREDTSATCPVCAATMYGGKCSYCFYTEPISVKEAVIGRDAMIVRAAFEYFLDELLIRDFEDNIQVFLDSDKANKNDSSGLCQPLFTVRSRVAESVNIHIKGDYSVLGSVDVLAHEMVHARQFLNGEILLDYEDIDIFFGLFKEKKAVLAHDKQLIDYTPYLEQNCEIEAFTKSPVLTSKFTSEVFNPVMQEYTGESDFFKMHAHVHKKLKELGYKIAYDKETDSNR